MINVSFFSSKKSFFLLLFLVFTQRTHAMETAIKSGIKACVGALPGLALSNAKHVSEHFVPAVIIAFLGSEHLTNFTAYSPGYKTQAAMVGISFCVNCWLFYKQSKLFEDPAAYDKQQLELWFALSSRSIGKTLGSKSARKFEDILQYYRQSLIKTGLLEFFILWGFSCTILALQKNLSFKAIQYSAFCAFWDVVPALAYLLWQIPKKDSQNKNEP